MARKYEFTRVEQAILDLLSDGRMHPAKEIHGCISDDKAPISAIYFHVWSIRKKLKPNGKGIATIKHNKRVFYCLTGDSSFI